METFSALLAICAGNSPVNGEFSAQRPVRRSFDVILDLRLNERLSKQPWGWWFETPSHTLWRHSYEEEICQESLLLTVPCLTWSPCACNCLKSIYAISKCVGWLHKCTYLFLNTFRMECSCHWPARDTDTYHPRRQTFNYLPHLRVEN